MEAPDKIYLAESLIKAPYGNKWSPTPYESRENSEYIRKDALLEWAKEKADTLFKTELNSAKDYGARTAFLELIDKINSL